MQEFPGNSQAAKRIVTEKPEAPAVSENASEPRQAKKVISGKSSVRKKSLGKRIKDVFLNDGGDYAEHIAENVIVPMLRDMALTIVTQMVDGVRLGFEEMLFGPDEDGNRRRRIQNNGSSRIAYHNMSRNGSTIRRRDDRPPVGNPQNRRRSNRVKQVILETREDADAVLEELDALIDNVGHCTVGDYYAAVDETINSTDEEWGWYDLARARVRKLDRDEFLIDFPPPRPMND